MTDTLARSLMSLMNNKHNNTNIKKNRLGREKIQIVEIDAFRCNTTSMCTHLAVNSEGCKTAEPI